MTATFRYRKNQVIQALRYHFISKIEMRIMIIAVNVLAAFALVLYALHIITPYAFLINALLWMLLMVSLWFILPYSVYTRNQTFKHKFTIVFDDAGFTLQHARGRRFWRYGQVQYFKETPGFFHLYYDARSFLLIPKNGLAGTADVPALRHLLSAHIAKV